MENIRTIAFDEGLDDVDEELAQTEINAAADPLTVQIATPFTQLRQDLISVRAEEVQHIDAFKAANARANVVDDQLDLIVEEVKTAVLAEVGTRYDDPRYTSFFDNQSPSEVKRPRLGDQLATMRAWVGPLQASTNTTLQDIGQRLAHIIQEADEVVKAQALAQQAMDAFEMGPRKAFIDRVNGQRKLAAGKIGEIIHAHPERKLPSNYVDRFFLQGAASRTPTIAELERSIARQKARLTRQEALLEELKAKRTRAEQARQQAELEARKQKLADAEKRATEAAAELAALKAKLGMGED
ncbi:MAG TPA: hypothetical protein VLS89_14100 [Candidatus Nanopelagicales bacterium]|nr:hypothetical protein [Candidatus Nanopelagicales bacterium]